MGTLRHSYLGTVDYAEGLRLQLELRERVRQGRLADTLLLLQHPPVITLGRSARRQHVLASDGALRRRGIELQQVSRGGDVTYHGPGQLVGYPVRRVARRVRHHVQGMAGALARVLERDHGVVARWEQGRPGLWTHAGKIAAVGVDARGGVAIHGFALNVRPDLGDYALIVPCGIQAAAVTSMAQLLGQDCPTVEQLVDPVAIELARQYGCEAVPVAPQDVLPP